MAQKFIRIGSSGSVISGGIAKTFVGISPPSSPTASPAPRASRAGSSPAIPPLAFNLADYLPTPVAPEKVSKATEFQLETTEHNHRVAQTKEAVAAAF